MTRVAERPESRELSGLSVLTGMVHHPRLTLRFGSQPSKGVRQATEIIKPPGANSQEQIAMPRENLLGFYAGSFP
jgi:hypothetical protein